MKAHISPKPIIVSLFFVLLSLILTSCAPQQGAKEQLSENTAATLKNIRTQKNNLQIIKDSLEKSQELAPKEQKKFPDQNLLETKAAKTYQAYTERQDAFAKFKAIQTDLKTNQTTLIKIGNQDYPDLPKQLISSLSQSLHISALDQKTFVTFMTEMSSAESDYYDMLSDSDTDKDNLNAQENRVNQYYAAIYQQIEIMNVNFNTALKQTTNLQKSLNN
ncbi:hypothetical protein ACNAN0_10860 [Agrilactobacillus fermenti]|uniref:hypothetical protein n=1 Tax=Agrilactobacillus fermenti TaxID=2586909 RepID=UPI001E5949B3|nr:hypothetical protein [Agrilactobacillus fermenti]MCD2255133.1 hypothetical protein [Agrilactobacillus fermenti]